MNFLKETIKNSNAHIWSAGLLISIALLTLVIYQIEFIIIKDIFNSISWLYFILSLLILLFEGFFTAFRFKLFTPGNPSLKNCLRVTSLFIISLIILPARLGEIAVIYLLKQHLNQHIGASIMNVLTQRLIDLIFLFTILFIFIFANKNIEQDLYVYTVIFLAISLLFLSIFKLDKFLSYIASLFLIKKNLIKNNLLKNIFRMILQARTWHRFHLNKSIILKAIIVSTGKWISNIGGITLLLYSLNVPLEEFQLLLTSTAYNLLAIIPLQSIGGFGISEAGLVGILVFFELPVDLAASVSIMCRIVLISTPFIFLFFVYSYLFLSRNEKQG